MEFPSEGATLRAHLYLPEGGRAPHPDFDLAAGCDLVIECVPERLDLKLRVFRELDRKTPAAAILASNSSGFPIAAMAGATERPERVIGWHWASPAYVMRFAEIVATDATAAEVTDAVVAVAARCGTCQWTPSLAR